MTKIPREYRSISNKLNSDSTDNNASSLNNFNSVNSEIYKAEEKYLKRADLLLYMGRFVAITLCATSTIISQNKQSTNRSEFYSTSEGIEYAHTKEMINEITSLEKTMRAWNNSWIMNTSNIKKIEEENKTNEIADAISSIAEKSSKDISDILQDTKLDKNKKIDELEKTDEYKKYKSQTSDNSNLEISGIILGILTYISAGLSKSSMKRKAYTISYKMRKLADAKYFF